MQLETVSYRCPELRTLLADPIKSSLSLIQLKPKIKSWRCKECTCRLCKKYKILILSEKCRLDIPYMVFFIYVHISIYIFIIFLKMISITEETLLNQSSKVGPKLQKYQSSFNLPCHSAGDFLFACCAILTNFPKNNNVPLLQSSSH